jgi:hypothetical protein
MPAHLSKSQQDLIYLDKHQRTLNIEPVFATIQGEKFQLEHIDRVKDVPGNNSLNRAMDLMKEPHDWDNIPSFLKGFKDAKRAIHPKDHVRMTRKACMAGRHDIIIECARRVDDTGFRLVAMDLVAELMWQLQDRAFKSNWSVKETKQALKWAEMVSDILEDPRHSGSRVVKTKLDPRIRPEVIGVLLQLAAVCATRFSDGVDTDQDVARYATRLLGSNLDVGLETLRTVEGDPLQHINLYLTHTVPVLHGMKLAQPILGGSFMALEERTVKLEEAIVAQRQAMLSLVGREYSLQQRFRGLATYDALIGPEAKNLEPIPRRQKQIATEVAPETKIETETVA